MPARPSRDLLGRVALDLDAEDAGRAPHDRRELVGLVVVEPERHSEPVAERRRQQTGARGRSDERERRDVERQRPRGHALADDDVQPEVLECRIEHLLDRRAEPVDLVDEEHVALLERGQDRRQITLPLERRTGDRADPNSELFAQDEGEARLAQPRRTHEQHVVERLTAGARRLERDRQLFLDPRLADEVVEPPRSQGALDLVVLGTHSGCEELLRHAALSACRTRSSGASSGSVPARARSASATE